MSTDMEPEMTPDDYSLLFNSNGSSKPIVDHRHLQFIQTYKDERIVVGASNLTGRIWNSSAWIFDDSTNFEKSQAIVNSVVDAVVCDGVFLEHDKFVIVEDSGFVEIFQIVDDSGDLSVQCLSDRCQHEDTVLSVSAFDKKNRIVTAGMDCCIKVWNTEDMVAEHSYTGAHRKIISCVDAMPKSDDVFASCSLDGEAVIWDVRQKKPAQVVYAIPERELMAIAWHPCDDNTVAIGGIDGFVTVGDTRNLRDIMHHHNVSKKAIHRLEFNKKSPHLLAVCSDDTELKVLTTKTVLSMIYRDNRHGDFVRGLAWYNGDLLSCAWDNTVLIHKIDKIPDN